MKIITISKIGYNHPSQANWSYGIWKVDTINTTGYAYQMGYTVKENFGGDSRLREALAEVIGSRDDVKVFETKGVYTTTGTQKITGISKMPIMDSKDFIKTMTEFINEKEN